MQGFLFSAPRRIEEVRQMLRARLDKNAVSVEMRRTA
jgi:hypothetical protein